MSKFEYFDEAGKKQICDIIRCAAIEYFEKEELDGKYRYVYELKGDVHETWMSDAELKESAMLAVDLLEELKKVNNEGIGREEYQKIDAEADFPDKMTLHTISICRALEYKNSEISNIITKLDLLRGLGEAEARLLANPCFRTAIVSVYAVMVDNFNNDDLYIKNAYFLLRAIMYMDNSSDRVVPEDEMSERR